MKKADYNKKRKLWEQMKRGEKSKTESEQKELKDYEDAGM